MNDLIIHDVQQGTDEWKQIKAGKFGGTTADTFLVNGRSDHGLGTGLTNLIYQKAAEFVTGPDLDHFVTPAMQRGTDLEPVARQRYEDEHFAQVEQVGYIQRGEFFGVSPDGLVGADGAIEIKCPGPPEFVRYMVTREISRGHYAQMQWLLFITGRSWCDYIVFHPEFAPLDLQGIVADQMTKVLEVVAQKEMA